MSALFEKNGTSHYQLSFAERVKVLDWMRGIGQSGIDKDRLDTRIMAKRAGAMLGVLVTESNVRGIAKAIGLKLPRVKYERAPADKEVKHPGVMFADLDIINERIERLEKACRAAGVEI